MEAYIIDLILFLFSNVCIFFFLHSVLGFLVLAASSYFLI